MELMHSTYLRDGCVRFYFLVRDVVPPLYFVFCHGNTDRLTDSARPGVRIYRPAGRLGNIKECAGLERSWVGFNKASFTQFKATRFFFSPFFFFFSFFFSVYKKSSLVYYSFFPLSSFMMPGIYTFMPRRE